MEAAKKIEIARPKLLLIAIEPDIESSVIADGRFELERITSVDEFAERFESWTDGVYLSVICGSALPELSSIELAQTMKNQCPATPKIFVSTKIEEYLPKKLLKNGFDQAMRFPLDRDYLKAQLDEIAAEHSGERVLKPVKVLDLGGSDEPVAFETFVVLPLNKKTVRFSRAGEKFDANKLGKLDKHNVHSVLIDKKDLPRFYDHTAQKLKKLASGDGALSETERKEKRTAAVRDLVMDLFDQDATGDISQGREFKSKSEKIVESYVSGGSDGLYDRLMSAVTSSDDGYEHVTSVTTLATLFAIGIGHPRPEDLAMAALFHELGLADFPRDLLHRPQSEWSEEQRQAFRAHPEASVRLVKEKRMIVSKEVEQAILQHHERFDGKGFPKGLPSSKICDEAQILSFADQFDELMQIEAGRERLSPLQAAQTIRDNKSVSPLLVDRIKVLFAK